MRVFEFRSEDQRQKIIAMLATSFQSVLQRLDPCCLRWVATPGQSSATGRERLSASSWLEVDFIRYKQDILLPWASDAYIPLNLTASLALSRVVESSHHVENVKLLLRHWTHGP